MGGGGGAPSDTDATTHTISDRDLFERKRPHFLHAGRNATHLDGVRFREGNSGCHEGRAEDGERNLGSHG